MAKAPHLPDEIFQRIAEKANQIYFVYDCQEGKFRFINHAFKTFFGKKAPELSKKPAALLAAVHPEDRPFVIENYQQLKNEQGQCELEFRMQPLKRITKSIFLRVFHFLGEDDQPYLAGIAEDITGRKQFEASLYDINARKNSVLEILAHDLSGPLAMIQTFASLLPQEYERQNLQQISEYSRLIQDTCRHSIDLITDFVNQEFLESVQVDLQKERIELVSRVQSIIDMYQGSEKRMAKKFKLKPSSDQIYIDLDEIKFMQVVNNLISNAIKFTHDNGSITVYLKEKKTSVQIIVKDNGIGIPENLQSSLFDKFTKARRPGLRGEKSIGLGMSIIKTIVELHGGKIWFESEENKGTVFYIEVPT